MLLPNGAQMVAASSAPVLPGPSPPFACLPTDLAREEDYVAPEITRHGGKSKRPAKGQVEEYLVLDRWHGTHDGFAI